MEAAEQVVLVVIVVVAREGKYIHFVKKVCPVGLCISNGYITGPHHRMSSNLLLNNNALTIAQNN